MSPEHKKTQKLEIPQSIRDMNDKIEKSNDLTSLHRKVDSCVMGINRLTTAMLGDEELGVDGYASRIKDLETHKKGIEKKLYTAGGALGVLVICKDWILNNIFHVK